MDPKKADTLIRLLEGIRNDDADRENVNRESLKQILTHLSRINSTLSAIDRNLTLLEMKK